jgi:hypothetical protein
VNRGIAGSPTGGRVSWLTDGIQSAILLSDQREATIRVSGTVACGLTEKHNTSAPRPSDAYVDVHEEA